MPRFAPDVSAAGASELLPSQDGATPGQHVPQVFWWIGSARKFSISKFFHYVEALEVLPDLV